MVQTDQFHLAVRRRLPYRNNNHNLGVLPHLQANHQLMLNLNWNSRLKLKIFTIFFHISVLLWTLTYYHFCKKMFIEMKVGFFFVFFSVKTNGPYQKLIFLLASNLAALSFSQFLKLMNTETDLRALIKLDLLSKVKWLFSYLSELFLIKLLWFWSIFWQMNECFVIWLGIVIQISEKLSHLHMNAYAFP